jgi:two-component system invasion response regulator UvrY
MVSHPIRVLLVDDHAIVRAGIRKLLESKVGYTVLEAASAEDALQAYGVQRPDVVVMDLNMPGMGGLEGVQRLRARDPHARILVLSMYDDPTHVSRMQDAGAMGYITKRSALNELTRAIGELMQGRAYFSADLCVGNSKGRRRGSGLQDLSKREFDVFCLLAEGRAGVSIAADLCLSPKTVSNHQTNIMRKLSLKNMAELTRLAIRHGVVEA